VHIEREDMRPCESERAGGAGSWPSHHAAQESDRRFVHDSLLEESGFEPLVPLTLNPTNAGDREKKRSSSC
jgi:hypothetical protein